MPDQESTRTHIGPFLRFIRDEMGLSLRQAAEVTHADYTYIGKVERGQVNPTDTWITSYVKLLGTHHADTEIGGAA